MPRRAARAGRAAKRVGRRPHGPRQLREHARWLRQVTTKIPLSLKYFTDLTEFGFRRKHVTVLRLGNVYSKSQVHSKRRGNLSMLQRLLRSPAKHSSLGETGQCTKSPLRQVWYVVMRPSTHCCCLEHTYITVRYYLCSGCFSPTLPTGQEILALFSVSQFRRHNPARAWRMTPKFSKSRTPSKMFQS